ncbi:hypothetical protein Tco_0961361 [Tanacetum coccineum]
MAVLESCPKHNMVAYLEKTAGNAEFHEVIDFLARSSIHNALTVSPVVSTTFVEQFWMSAKSKIINNVRYITAKVAGKPVSISEASIRSDLLFDDADGIDSLPNQAIFDAIQLMGYEGDLTVLTFNKALFSPQWRFLFHTMNHCISSKSTSWDQIPTNIATAVICLTSNQKYNFSKLIFDGMLRHLDAKKKFVMYPRFISIFLDKQLMNVPVPLDHFPVNALTSKVFSFMVKKGKHFSGKVTPLFASMLVQPTEDEGATSERPSEPQPTPSPPHPSEANVEPQSDPSPRPSPTTHIPDSIPESSGGNHGGHSSSDKSLSGNEGDMTLQSVYDLCISLCTQVTDQAKEMLVEYEHAAMNHVSHLEPATKAALSNEYDFIQAKMEADRLLALRLQDEEREKFTVEERAKFLHDTIAAQRRFLAEQRAIAIRNKPPTRTQLRNQMMTYLKHVGNKKHSDLKKKTFEEIPLCMRKVKSLDKKRLKKKVAKETPKTEDTAKAPVKVDVTEQGTKKGSSRLDKVHHSRGISCYSTGKWNLRHSHIYWRFDTIMMESYKKKMIKVDFLDGTVIHMLVERRYPLSKDLLQRMLNLGLEVERESTTALDLIRFIKQQIDEN